VIPYFLHATIRTERFIFSWAYIFEASYSAVESECVYCFQRHYGLWELRFHAALNNISFILDRVRKQQGAKTSAVALGRPDMKEMNENVAANECLAFMIRHVKNLFMVGCCLFPSDT